MDGIDMSFKAKGLERHELIGAHGRDIVRGPKKGNAPGVCNRIERAFFN
jgi:hypothetical protein